MGEPTPITDEFFDGELDKCPAAEFCRTLERRIPKTTDRAAINTNVRLFDLVRFMRAELHEQNLISDEEYGWLCSSEMATSSQGGSPSPRRLEDYDQLRIQFDTLREALRRIAVPKLGGKEQQWIAQQTLTATKDKP